MAARGAYVNKNNCVFCKIITGKIPCYRVYEDDTHIAFLDIFPNIKGQTLVVPKEHLNSYLFDVDVHSVGNLMHASKRVAKLLEKGLHSKRVNVVFEGTGVNHLHAKLYPTNGVNDARLRHIVAEERIYFEEYPGYVTTLMGPKASDEDLEMTCRAIKRTKSSRQK